jgi:site-specific DNA-methyltransferase (adenine-specific)
MLSDLKSRGEPGAVVYLADCVGLMRLMPAGSIDVIFVDPPYRLSGGGVTVKSGRIASVAKGEWDRSMGLRRDFEWNVR